MKVTPQLAVGASLVLFGALLTLDLLGIVPTGGSVRFFLPLIVFLVGAWKFNERRDSGGRIFAGLMMFFGAWLFLNTLGVMRVGFWDLFWPVVLIAFGAKLVMQAIHRADTTASTAVPPGLATTAAQSSGTGSATLLAVLGSTKRALNDKPFRSGEMTSIMGGCELDLRQAEIAPGAEAIINVVAVMGGHEVSVPTSWAVVSEVTPILGSVDDKRNPEIVVASRPPGELAPRLVIRGVIVMGELTIKN